MSLLVTIAGVEVLTSGIVITNMISSRPDNVQFDLLTEGVVPAPGQTVMVYRDTTANPLFGGVIVSLIKCKLVPGKYRYRIVCSDFQRLLSRRLVIDVYENKTCKQIIEAFVADYTDAALGFTTNNVQTGPTINKIVYNYVPLSECIRELAAVVGYFWYVDSSRDIHFFVKETSFAPFEIDDTALLTKVDRFSLQPDYSQVRNRVFVRGGKELTSNYVQSIIADGAQREFKLVYKPAELTMTVDGIAKTVGIEFLDEG